MVVAAHQPIFLPWPGIFYKALHADALVLLDDVQFPLGRSFLTRNRLKGSPGELWLRVPVLRAGRGRQRIREVEICYGTDWRRKHLETLRQQYARAPYREEYQLGIESIYARRLRRLVDLSVDLLRFLGRSLGLEREPLLQSDLGASGRGSDLLVGICSALGAKTYLTLPTAEKFLDAEKFRAAGVAIATARFLPPVYPQLWGDFRYNLSTLDLLLNCGPKSLEILGGETRRSQVGQVTEGRAPSGV